MIVPVYHRDVRFKVGVTGFEPASARRHPDLQSSGPPLPNTPIKLNPLNDLGLGFLHPSPYVVHKRLLGRSRLIWIDAAIRQRWEDISHLRKQAFQFM